MEEIVTGAVIGVLAAVITEKAFPKFSKGCKNAAKASIKSGLFLGHCVKKSVVGTVECFKDVYAEAKFEFEEKKQEVVTAIESEVIEETPQTT